MNWLNVRLGKTGSTGWHLGSRLAVCMALLFIAIFALVALSHYQKLDNQKEDRVDSMQQAERTIAAVFDNFVGDLESFSLSTAITLGDAQLPIKEGMISNEARDSVNAYLQHLFESYGVLRAIFVTDPNGIVVYDNDGNSAGRDLSERSYIKALQDGADSYWSEGIPGLESGRTTVTLGRRIVMPDGNTSGFLVIAFYPESLVERLPPDIAGEGHISLIDQQGQLLLSLASSDEEVPRAAVEVTQDADLLSWPPLEAARSGSEVTVRSQEVPLQPEDSYAALSRLDRVDWVVSYSLPASAINGRAIAIFQRDLLLLAGLMVAGMAVALYIGHRVSQPLTRLGRLAQAIARGEDANDELVDVKTSEIDISALAATMQQMNEAIQSREEQLSLQTAVIESIERTGESLASELDIDKTVSSIIEAGVKLTHAQSSLFLYRRGSDKPFEPAGQRGLVQQDLVLDSPLLESVTRGQTVHLGNLEVTGGHSDANGSSVQPDNQPRSVLGVPVQSRRGVVIGALFLTHSATGAFSLHDLRLARGLARWAGIVLENAELFRESQEASELLRRANEDKDEFLAMVSHELRTPITTIFGGSRLLRQRRPLLSEEAVEDMINAVAEEAEQLYHLVEDLLAMARTESSGAVEREPVAISQLLRQVADQAMRGRDRQVTLAIAEDFPPVLADPTYITQIVGNLLSNANKYTPDGLPIEVEATHDGQYATVRVSDHGPGVPEDEIEQIFERFFRSAQASSSVSGKGLGLTVCKRLVEAMQGQIEAQNRPEGGLRVTFTLELAAELAADDEEAPTAMKGEAAQQDHSFSLSEAATSHESGPRRDLQ